MPVVTLAALYGAGGSVIGPRVAATLRVAYLDRAIPAAATPGSGSLEEADPGLDELPRTGIERVTASLGRLSTITGGAGGSLERLDASERHARGRIEGFLAEACQSGGVALGRGGMVILRTVPWALHVHLGGTPQLRVERAMALEGVDRATARARQRAEDGARASYVRRAYGVDGEDPALYHLMLDTTALDDDACVDLIVSAAISRTRNPRPSPPI